MCCWDCGGNSGCAAAVGNVGGWRSVLIGWIGSVISGIAVLTNFWKPDVSSSMVSPAVGLDNDPGSGVPVWTSIQWAAGSVKKSSGCWKRTTTGRTSPGPSEPSLGHTFLIKIGGFFGRPPLGSGIWQPSPGSCQEAAGRLWAAAGRSLTSDCAAGSLPGGAGKICGQKV